MKNHLCVQVTLPFYALGDINKMFSACRAPARSLNHAVRWGMAETGNTTTQIPPKAFQGLHKSSIIKASEKVI